MGLCNLRVCIITFLFLISGYRNIKISNVISKIQDKFIVVHYVYVRIKKMKLKSLNIITLAIPFFLYSVANSALPTGFSDWTTSNGTIDLSQNCPAGYICDENSDSTTFSRRLTLEELTGSSSGLSVGTIVTEIGGNESSDSVERCTATSTQHILYSTVNANNCLVLSNTININAPDLNGFKRLFATIPSKNTIAVYSVSKPNFVGEMVLDDTPSRTVLFNTVPLGVILSDEGSTVSVFDIRTLEVLHTYSVGSGPVDAVMAKLNSNFLLVGNKKDSTLSAINLNSGEVTSFDLPLSPSRFISDGIGRVYVLSINDRKVGILDFTEIDGSLHLDAHAITVADANQQPTDIQFNLKRNKLYVSIQDTSDESFSVVPVDIEKLLLDEQLASSSLNKSDVIYINSVGQLIYGPIYGNDTIIFGILPDTADADFINIIPIDYQYEIHVVSEDTLEIWNKIDNEISNSIRLPASSDMNWNAVSPWLSQKLSVVNSHDNLASIKRIGESLLGYKIVNAGFLSLTISDIHVVESIPDSADSSYVEVLDNTCDRTLDKGMSCDIVLSKLSSVPDGYELSLEVVIKHSIEKLVLKLSYESPDRNNASPSPENEIITASPTTDSNLADSSVLIQDVTCSSGWASKNTKGEHACQAVSPSLTQPDFDIEEMIPNETKKGASEENAGSLNFFSCLFLIVLAFVRHRTRESKYSTNTHTLFIRSSI